MLAHSVLLVESAYTYSVSDQSEMDTTNSTASKDAASLDSQVQPLESDPEHTPPTKFRKNTKEEKRRCNKKRKQRKRQKKANS